MQKFFLSLYISYVHNLHRDFYFFQLFNVMTQVISKLNTVFDVLFGNENFVTAIIGKNP